MKTFLEWFKMFGEIHRDYWLDGERNIDHQRHKEDMDLARKAWVAGREYERANPKGK